MATLALAVDLPPRELLRRLPRRPGTFLLDGGSLDSWRCGEALLGCEAERIVSVAAPPHGKAPEGAAPEGAAPEDGLAQLDAMLEDRSLAGVVCALSYDLGRTLERLGPQPPADLGTPLLFAAAHRWVLAYSYRQRRYELRSPDADESALRAVASRLEQSARSAPRPHPAGGTAALKSNLTRSEYLDAVQRILAYIEAGDVYQVNFAQRFEISAGHEPPADLFARILARHPATFSAYVDGGAWTLVSASPECFLRRDGDRVATFPIKGTAARGVSPEHDKAVARGLRSSVKDGAEHLMIVDLERNDLGRVCRFGSISVPRMASLYTLPELHHLESEVAGVLRPGTSTAALLRATFPGGSVTGAPKIRAMQIIDELEPVARGFYTGAIGFADGNGTARFNIAIRTAVVTGDRLAYHAGGGIVADSRPEAEYEETWLKTRSFVEALCAEGR